MHHLTCHPALSFIKGCGAKQSSLTADERLQAQGHFRSAFSKRQWTQERLHTAKLVDTDVCQACGQAKGTIEHRLWQCPAVRQACPIHPPLHLHKSTAKSHMFTHCALRNCPIGQLPQRPDAHRLHTVNTGIPNAQIAVARTEYAKVKSLGVGQRSRRSAVRYRSSPIC